MLAMTLALSAEFVEQPNDYELTDAERLLISDLGLGQTMRIINAYVAARNAAEPQIVVKCRVARIEELLIQRIEPIPNDAAHELDVWTTDWMYSETANYKETIDADADAANRPVHEG